jgi:two-component system sensor histidine kinase HupT/HoxJ
MATFRDNGPGIAAEALDKIFDPFYTTKAVGKGTGLGLSISYGIVERHGGRLAAGNAAEGGAEFVLRLPCLQGA